MLMKMEKYTGNLEHAAAADDNDQGIQDWGRRKKITEEREQNEAQR